jgi:hypothetical protein
MAVDTHKETVVVDNGERRSHSGLITLVVILGLILLFFLFGGFNLFSGGGGSTTNVNVTPYSSGTGR